MKRRLWILFISLILACLLFLSAAYPNTVNDLLHQILPKTDQTHITSADTTPASTIEDTLPSASHVSPDFSEVASDTVTSPVENTTEKLEPLTTSSEDLKTDYLPMDGSGKLIDEPAKGSENTPPASNAGSEYSFDPVFYPYYYMLDADQQTIYKQVYANALAVNTDAFSPVTTLPVSKIDPVMSAVYNDHPELFWLDTKYSYTYTPQRTVHGITLAYNSTADDLPSSKDKFEEAANAILSGVPASDLEKEKCVHDILMNTVTYNEAAPMHQSAYSALVNHESVCAGYSRAFQYLMMQLQIPCYYCTGTASGGSHAWNIIKLDNDYYNLDTSWDDARGTALNRYCYTYFNLPDNEFSADHARTGLSVNLPACNGTDFTYAATYGNGTPDTSTASGDTYQDCGFQDADVISDISTYYSKCASLLTQAGIGEHTFSFVLADENLMQEIYAQTQQQAYVDAYVRDVASSLGLTSCNISVKLQAEQLADGYVLLEQTVALNGTVVP